MLLSGPKPPRVRQEALTATYAVRRRDGISAVLLRVDSGAEVELAASSRRLGVDWSALAGALLADALEAPPQRRLVSDYARFLAPARGQERRIAGAELQAWLDTWRPSILAVLTSGR